MTHEEENLRKLTRERTARVKRILRWLPRRATLHRYPVLKWFSASARRRPHLWTFRVSAAIPALYAGSILALSPAYGIQLPIAILLAFWLRANLPILFGLQWLTNPLTFVPIYYADYQIGKSVLAIFRLESPHLNIHQLRLFFDGFHSGFWKENLSYAIHVWGVMTLGGIIIGTFVGAVLSILYRVGSQNATLTYQRLHALQEKRRQQAEKDDQSPKKEQTELPFSEGDGKPPPT